MTQPEHRDPDSTDSYTVAWICALEEEYFCACRMLDQECNGLEISEDKDDNTYVYGRIAKHYVVVACLPAGRYGTNSAARVARDMDSEGYGSSWCFRGGRLKPTTEILWGRSELWPSPIAQILISEVVVSHS